MTTGKTIALTIWTFVGKVMSLLLKTLSGFDIATLPRSRCLLISWLQSLSTLILEPKKMKSDTVYTFFPPICHKVMTLDAMIWFLCLFSVQLEHLEVHRSHIAEARLGEFEHYFKVCEMIGIVL